MGDVVRERAQQLVEFVGAQGFLVTIGEAVRALNRFRGSFHRARRFIEDNARRNLDNTVQSRFQQRLGPVIEESPYDMGYKRQRTTALDAPSGRYLSGPNVTVGDKAVSTKSATNCVARSLKYGQSLMSMLNRSVIHNDVFRWQSIYKFDNADSHRVRSIGLNTVGVKDAENVIKKMALPMYAFDLGTSPVQAIGTVNTKTRHKYESVPMYRLYKSTAGGRSQSLQANVQNYFWEPQAGYQNGPSIDYAEKNVFQWGPELMRAKVGDYEFYKNLYNHIDVLLKCHRTMACKVHFSIVRFRNKTGPERKFTVDTAYDKDATGDPTFYSNETQIITEEIQDSDVFWESFWSKKLCHPLSKFNMDRKKSHISFVKDEVVNVNPEEVTTSEAYFHRKMIQHYDGTAISLSDNYNDDLTLDGTYGEQPPVVLTKQAGDSAYFQFSYGYNPIIKTDSEHKLYHADDDLRSKNCWLLIWMESDLIEAKIPVVADTVNLHWPSNTIGLDLECCSFDIKVRRAVQYVERNNYATS